MTEIKTKPLRERKKDLARETVLDAAERLLNRGDGGDFSMRALAAEAGVGFATPFNHFGNKNAIVQALSARMIDRMFERFADCRVRGTAVDRVLAMGRIAVGVLLERPGSSKIVIGSLGVVDSGSPAVRVRSTELWAAALGDMDGIVTASQAIAGEILAEHLALQFRGCLSFWVAGELRDDRLEETFACGAIALMLGFCRPTMRPALLQRLVHENR